MYAIPVIKKIVKAQGRDYVFDLFTHQPKLFAACPYVENVYSIKELDKLNDYARKHATLNLFETDKKYVHAQMDTVDFISVPMNGCQLTFKEKTLEYFPVEQDMAERYDVVLNTSATWRSRTWDVALWQRLADELTSRGLTVAVVGKDVFSEADDMTKTSPPLQGCVNLVNQLSLDQTFFTINKSRLFVTCQNGLSVLSGATDAQVVVLDISIEWSRHALWRNESPYYKVRYVKGQCDIYCARATCPLPGVERDAMPACLPEYERVRSAVLECLGLE